MKLLLRITLILLLVPTWSFAQALPAFPMAFWGSVTINGAAAPSGSVVRAYYGSTLAGTATVLEAGIYGYTEAIKQKLVISEGTGAITFKIQAAGFNGGAETEGNISMTHSGFTSGLTVPKDLAFTVSVPSAPVASAPSGGGNAGGGGASVVQTTTTSTAKADATGDNKTDVFDFNSLLIQWGKSGTLTADFDKNGIVDILDFNLLLINWTK